MKRLPRNIRAGQNLKRIREIKCLRQKELADLSGLKAAQISHFETGEKGIGPATTLKLAKAINVPPEELTRMLQSNGDDARLRLSLAIYQEDITDLISPFMDLIELRRLARDHKLSADAWDHLIRQIQILYRLSKAAVSTPPGRMDLEVKDDPRNGRKIPG